MPEAAKVRPRDLVAAFCVTLAALPAFTGFIKRRLL